ncbi:MAG: GMC family oxidoreductase N-terminal domain-containing protein [Candidatus Atribacteria bacterium]|nr:GMC family oxidoreductase N-terminal domain-containing protein [Candidatus Atribacteria bacterium]
MKRVIVVGSGAGGATVAKELAGKFAVTLLEAGREFRPFSLPLSTAWTIKRTGILFDERIIQFFFPAMKVRRVGEGMMVVNGRGVGGTTTLSTGNALRVDEDLREMGIDLDEEFDELTREIPITDSHQRLWRKNTRRLFDLSQQMGLNPMPMPKMGHYEHCANCGRCVLGCPRGVKWDSREFVRKAVGKGALLQTGGTVEKVLIREGEVTGVKVRWEWGPEFVPADLVVLAAGGLGTPAILQRSGISTVPRLFVDPVLCVAVEWEGVHQSTEIPMPFVIQREHYIFSPYFDFLSFFFNRRWRSRPENILGLMIKIADSNSGFVSGSHISKTLTIEDHARLQEGVELCNEILLRFGAKKENIFLGTLNAGHPGGMLPLTINESQTLHSPFLPPNLYVADATLFPRSLGNPPILTIMALAKRVSFLIQKKLC